MDYREQYKKHCSLFWRKSGPFGVFLVLRACQWYYGNIGFRFICPDCKRFLNHRAKWSCSACDHINGIGDGGVFGLIFGGNLRSFMHQCRRCREEPDSVQCPNRACNKKISLDSRATTNNTAVLVDLISDTLVLVGEIAKIAAPEVEKENLRRAQRAQKEYDRETTLEDIRFKTQLESELGKLYQAARKRREWQRGTGNASIGGKMDQKRQKITELEQELDARMASEEASETVLRERAEQHKDNPRMLEKIQAWIEDWQARHIP
jgi:hypothetical protein